MPFVTVQLGQCGNQLGASWFDTLAEELSHGSYGFQAAETFFLQQHDSNTAHSSNRQWAARAVLVDMEPKVIYSAKQTAAASSYCWCYAPGCSVSGQSGSGNNWALGHNKYGPAMAPAVLDLVRKQAEACDTCEGFFMLQSMAGGTGAGAGTYLAEALVDAYPHTHMLNCCVWPYESGEVAVQPYNTLLSMSTLAELSSGILLLQNEVLHAMCTRLLDIKHPGFKDLNAVAARGLASALLPCRARPIEPAASGGSGSSIVASSSGSGSGSTNVGSTGGSFTAGAAAGSRPSSARCSSESIGANAAQHQEFSTLPLSPIADLACHLFSHPSYRVASLRCVPQVAAGSMDFTTFTWRSLLSRLKAMSLAGVYLDEHLSSYMAADGRSSLPLHKYKNKAASAFMVLRGREAGGVPVPELADPNWYAGWAVDPLMVASHPAKFGGCPMAATVLATDQACVAPLRPMQNKAYSMLAARAYTHHYEAYGLQVDDFQHCFAVVEDLMAAYAAM